MSNVDIIEDIIRFHNVRRVLSPILI